ncbi:GntR family transcriptional regulator [Paenibacillus agricola]|uniref:GntR family transcriptional regulator n=1 Tax=Paenibacillus agricola TaxID=2716264 RepID=A0ABX0J805_9BACL|nr:GntR family transcriptional regulator [Paenibacillus agricola]NHN31456.1 GntR family transcriptional regulator [Paenibacillus agricola]
MQFPAIWLHGDSLGEKISCELRLRIINGTISPETVITENQLAAEFGTSRSPIRDALKTLSNEGLIRMERMGAVVIGLNLKDMKELNDVRFLIEEFAIQTLSDTYNELKIKELQHIIDKMKLAANHDEPVQFAYYDLLFHETIIRSAQHTRILHMWNHIRYVVLTTLLVATERRFFNNKPAIQPLINRHKLIVDALVSRDHSYINRIVREHFLDTKKTLDESLFQ